MVYGSTASDRNFLNAKINGYQPPSIAEILNSWRRIAGANIYSDISSEPQTPAYCFSGFDSNYNWNAASNGTTTIAPGTYTNCVNSNVHTSNAWNYIASPDRLYNASNASSFIGFLSGLQFKEYNLEAVVSSADTDDDAIGLIIASTVVSGNVHTLTALRTHGGQQPNLGWAIVHRINNNINRIFGEKSVGDTHKNGTSGTGDKLGWNGRNTRIRVERADNIIKAYASTWGTGGVAGSVSSTSEIVIDLSDTANNLTQFQGPQYYGYGTISQLGATFTEINFNTPTATADPSYIYDLMNNTVYIKNVSGGYTLMNGTQAYSTIGFPKKVKNTETQKEFMIDSAGGYTEL